MENAGNITSDMIEDQELFERFVNGGKKGSIALPVPAANITEWYGDRSPWTLVTGLSTADMEKVIYYAGYLVVDPKDTYLTRGAILNEKDLAEAEKNYGEGSFAAAAGAEAIDSYLDEIGLNALYEQSREEERACMKELTAAEDVVKDAAEYTEEQSLKESELMKKLENIRARIDACIYLVNNRDRFLIRNVRVFPLQMRPMVWEAANRTPYGIFHDLGSLYFSVAVHAERLQKLIDIKAPDVIVRNEKRLLQEYVDNLLANGLRTKPKTKGDGVPLLCLRDIVLREIEFC